MLSDNLIFGNGPGRKKNVRLCKSMMSEHRNMEAHNDANVEDVNTLKRGGVCTYTICVVSRFSTKVVPGA